jgi:hypothetical protein
MLELAEHGVPLVDDQGAVEEFAADAADEAFGDRRRVALPAVRHQHSRQLAFLIKAGVRSITA